MRALASRPFSLCDSRRVSLWYLSAGLRYTTFHIRAREFDPLRQAVQVQKKLLRLALAARRPAVTVLRPVAGALVGAPGIGDHLPQEGPDETHVRVKGARPQVAGGLTRLVFWGTTGACSCGSLESPRLG